MAFEMFEDTLHYETWR